MSIGEQILRRIHNRRLFFWGLLFAFGLWSFGAGLYWATSSYVVTNQNGIITAVFPNPPIGALISILGIVVTIFAYFGIKGRIILRSELI